MHQRLQRKMGELLLQYGFPIITNACHCSAETGMSRSLVKPQLAANECVAPQPIRLDTSYRLPRQTRSQIGWRNNPRMWRVRRVRRVACGTDRDLANLILTAAQKSPYPWPALQKFMRSIKYDEKKIRSSVLVSKSEATHGRSGVFSSLMMSSLANGRPESYKYVLPRSIKYVYYKYQPGCGGKPSHAVSYFLYFQVEVAQHVG